MDRPGVKCQRCPAAATVHITEMAGGVALESHFCYDHGREEGFAGPPTKARVWPDDDFHTTVEVTARQVREGEDVVARFPDGVEVGLSGWKALSDCILRRERTFVKIVPEEGSQERGPRFVRVKLVPETPKQRN